ncbi:lysine exporter protein LysE/YggA [Psychromonas sp. CNPT3]|uniref:LysE family translocator n=1 Tax=Psychromonas sp. CNPT3 TaxID=314282 RepID=UPI0002C0B3EA|nr:LysE family translocator [Psychromonas sp. CNPT3]AGH81162.1 lysine exporter protein LysE/YggA [Psychromonas sp. CNPT3]
MFPLELLFSYITAVTILVMMPGVDSLLTITMTKTLNWKAGILVAVGNLIGGLSLTIVSSLLIAGFLSMNETVNTFIQVASSLYLLRMGWQIYHSEPCTPKGHISIKKSKIVTTAIMSNLSNPKALTFFLFLIPQFVTTTSSTGMLQQALVLGFILNVIGFCYLSSLALLASKIKMSFMQSAHTNKIIGILFASIAFYLLYLRFN